MTEYITREAALMAVCRADLPDKTEDGTPILNGKRKVSDCVRRIKAIPAADVRPVPKGGIGEMSDGYHTFNGLYYQRMVLFAALVKAYKDRAWKSYRHEDGEYCFGGDWFIVGIDTPEGSYTYHYENKYWEMFNCIALPRAKHWDGHTEKDAETRLMSLPDVAEQKHGMWGYRWEVHGDGRRPTELFPCSECGYENTSVTNFCPNCGADMRGEQNG